MSFLADSVLRIEIPTRLLPVAACFAVFAAPLPLQAAAAKLAANTGVWQSRGYGQILEISAQRVVTYDISSISCLSVKESAFPGAEAEYDRVSRTGDSLSFFADAGVTRYTFDRLSRLPAQCHPQTSRPATDPEFNFDVLWQAFREHYAFFDLHGVDWEGLGVRLRALGSGTRDDAQLFGILSQAVGALGDGHVVLQGDGRRYSSGRPGELRELWMKENGVAYEDWPSHAPAYSRFVDSYVRSALHGKAKSGARRLLTWGWLRPGIGYLNVSAMYVATGPDGRSIPSSAQRALIDETMPRVLADFAKAKAVVVDVRFNGGGYDAMALQLAGYFADRSREVLTKKAVSGAGFTEPQSFVVEPRGRSRYTGPIYLLQSGNTASAAEIFVLAMKTLPKVERIGTRTYGVLSDTLGKRLPNGWTVTLSNEIYTAADGKRYEGGGIPPDVDIGPPAGTFDARLRQDLDVLLARIAGNSSGRPEASAVAGVTRSLSLDLSQAEVPYERQVLPNGLTLIVHENHDAPIVAVGIWYRVGSRDERAGRGGFAHLFEHLMFVGSEHHDDEFFRPMRSAGATDLSGITLRDITSYYQTVPTDALDLTLWLESDRMGHFVGAIDQKKLDAQRGVVQNEKRQYGNLPYGSVDGIIGTHTYPPEHPYSREVFGSMRDLDAATLDDVREWVRNYQGAANALVVIAGDITPAQARKKVEYYFGGIAGGPSVAREQSWVAKMSGERRMAVQDRVPQPRLYKTWNIPGYATRERTLLKVVAEILGRDKTGRLFTRLVDRDRVATAVQVGVSALELGCQLQVIVTVPPDVDLRVAESALDDEMAAFLRAGPTEAELERAQAAQFARFVRGGEFLGANKEHGRSSVLALGELFGDSPDFHRRALTWVRAAQPADVRAVARQWLSDGVFVLEVRPLVEHSVSTDSVDRSKLPQVGARPPVHLPSPQRTTLSNGLEVVLVERHTAPIVDLTLVIDAGVAADLTASPGLAALAFDMLGEGTSKRDALQFAERLQSLGARLETSSSLDASFMRLDALADALDESLELFGETLTDPALPPAAFERLKGARLAQIRQEKSDPRSLALRLMPQLLYGSGHAYSGAPSGSGTAAAISASSLRQLENFFRCWVRPDNATLLIVGATTLDRVKPMLERRLGRWQAPSEPRPRKLVAAVGTTAGSRVFLLDRPGAEQSMIVAARPAPARSDEGFIPAAALNAVFGGGFLSRLNMNLRERKHWAYVVNSRLLAARGASAFIVEAPVQTDKTADAMREMAKELRELAGLRPATAGELRTAREALVLALPRSNEPTASWSLAYADLISAGLPESYWNDSVARIERLTPADLRRAASDFSRPDELTWIVVGDLASIESNVRALGFGPVKILDGDGMVLR